MSWEALAQVVAPHVLTDAFDTSERLRALGIPHALVGGLAVGHHGHPRATKDVDFIVGEAAFASIKPLIVFRDELADVVRWGVIDLLAALPEDPALVSALQLPERGEVPLVPIEVLVLMKLPPRRLTTACSNALSEGAGPGTRCAIRCCGRSCVGGPS